MHPIANGHLDGIAQAADFIETQVHDFLDAPSVLVFLQKRGELLQTRTSSFYGSRLCVRNLSYFSEHAPRICPRLGIRCVKELPDSDNHQHNRRYDQEPKNNSDLTYL